MSSLTTDPTKEYRNISELESVDPSGNNVFGARPAAWAFLIFAQSRTLDHVRSFQADTAEYRA
jgi:hypothetical protein